MGVVQKLPYRQRKVLSRILPLREQQIRFIGDQRTNPPRTRSYRHPYRGGRASYIEINSALVSAQNRQRFYVHNCGNVEQPEDRGILLRDILESGTVDKEKSYVLKHQAGNARDYFKKHHTQVAFEPVRVGALPVNPLKNGKGRCVTSCYSCKGANHVLESNYSDDPNKQKWDSVAEPVCFCSEIGCAIACEFDENGNPLKAICQTDGKTYNVHLVREGVIELHGKYYPISLPDGYWIIRKLTVAECCRLQTLPDDYCRAVSDTQAYKGIGNGWTAEVIIHILNGALKDVPRDEKILILSMYDGIGTGRYCLDKMGFTNVEYHAYEIDKYAMKIAQSNYPDIIQHGDAFAVRKERNLL